MDYLQFYCKECKFHGYDVFGKGLCYHPEVGMQIGGWCRACYRFRLYAKEQKKRKNA